MSDQGIKFKLEADVDQAGKDIDDFSKKSRVALTNLTQVVQDLPYGFIGIQNNLPYLVSSFNELSKEVGGSDKAIMSLIQSLRGTVGLVFAFSTVTSIVTFLINEFGSLSNAYDALVRSSGAAATATREFNKQLDDSNASAQAQKTELIALFEVLGNTNIGYDKRIQAFKEIEKLNGGHIKGIKDEKDALTLTNDELDKYLNLLTRQINLESQAEALKGTLTKVYGKFYDELNKLKDEDILQGAKLILKGFSEGEFNPAIAFIKGASTTTQEYANAITELNVALKNNKKDQLEVQSVLGGGGGVKDTVKKLSTDVEDLSGKWSYEKQISELQKLRSTLLDVNYVEKDGQRIIKGFVATDLERKNALAELQKLYPEELKNISLQMSGYEDLDDATFTLIRTLQNLRDETIANQKASQLQTQADRNSLSAKDALEKKNNELYESLIKVSMGNEKFFSTLGQGMFNIESWVIALEQTKQITDEYYNVLDDLANTTKDKYNEIEQYVSSILTRPLNFLVNDLLEKGKVTWKEFADIAIESLKRIAAQVAINAIINAIASALSPGSASVIDLLKKAKTGDLKNFLDLTSYMDEPGIGGFTPARVQGPGLGIGGEVVFVQRGADLVGVLNRTNSNINRIG